MKPVALAAALALTTFFTPACSKSNAATSAPSGSAKAASASPMSHVDGNNYAVDTASSCSANDCTATITLKAQGGYHINDDYPYKFKAQPIDGVAYKTADGTFGKTTGDFAKVDATTATVTVRFTAQKSTTINGTFKLSVCSQDNCQIEQPELSIDVKV
jgi:hypothetical protein